MKVTAKELQNARIDLAYRDHCSHLLIPLNKCRRQTFYMPYECSHERHEYEKCQYFEYVPAHAYPLIFLGSDTFTSFCATNRYRRREDMLKK